LFPGGNNPATVDRLQAFLRNRDRNAVGAYSAFLWGLEAAAMARYLRPFTSLDLNRRSEMLQNWHNGDLGRRVGLRLSTLPLKMMHFDDPELYKLLDCPYMPAAARPEKGRWRSQIMTGDDLDPADDELEADVVVVGTGAGGAVVAKELAQKGWAVLMVEEGQFYDRSDFTTRPRLELQQEVFRGQGMLPTLGNTSIAVMVGKSVGGTTTINSGTCFRTPDHILQQWQHEHGLHELTSEAMAPHFDRVEEILGVEPASWAHLGGVAEVIRDGCEALGYSHHPLSRNAPGCDGQGLCCFGCPTDAKRSTNVSYVPLALQNSAMCLTGARVNRIIINNGTATGVEAELAVDGGAATRKLRIKAQYVVLACGTIYTPLLLAENNLCNRFGQVGRHLTIHPAMGINALFEREIKGWDAIPQGYCIDEFSRDGLMFEGAFVPLEAATAAFPIVGHEFTRAMEAYNHMATFGFMISDHDAGRVLRGPNGAPLIYYNLDKDSMRLIRRGFHELGKVFFAAGAKRLYAPVHGHELMDNEDELYELATADLKPYDVEMSAYHPLGTCRLGSDPRHSVIDHQHETYEVNRLFVVDGSSVPSSLGVNPQISIMALATRFSELLDERMRRESN